MFFCIKEKFTVSQKFNLFKQTCASYYGRQSSFLLTVSDRSVYHGSESKAKHSFSAHGNQGSSKGDGTKMFPRV